MKIAKTNVEELRLKDKKSNANLGCNICPCCGEDKTIMDYILKGSEYCTIPNEFDFDTKFPTWIIAYCPDTCSWFVTNERFFFYEYHREFQTQAEGIEYFTGHIQEFYDLETKMLEYRPSFAKNKVFLEDVGELSI